MYRSNRVRFLVFITLLLALSACTPWANPATSTVPAPAQLSTVISPTSTRPMQQATSTPIPTATLISTATEIQLPLEIPTVVGGGIDCDLPAVELPVSDAQRLSEDEIAAKLVDMYFSRYTNPQMKTGCRIDGYRIEEVIPLGPGLSKQLEPDADFVLGVSFSVKLIQLKCLWATYSGEIDQQNWLHTTDTFAITKVLNPASEEVYTIKIANP